MWYRGALIASPCADGTARTSAVHVTHPGHLTRRRTDHDTPSAPQSGFDPPSTTPTTHRGLTTVRVPVTDLVGHPGETRALTRAVDPGEFGDAPWGPLVTRVTQEVALDLHLDAVVEGILVRGWIGFTVEVPCARCLEPQHVRRDVDVAELFVDPTRRTAGEDDDPGYELIDDLTAIDLTTMVRDTLVVDLPVRFLCSEACLGLCPVCGTDRNRLDCGHRPGAAPDPRWAVLAELDLPED